MVKCTEQDLNKANAEYFYSSKGMKYLHKFAVSIIGVFVKLNTEWVKLTEMTSLKNQEDIELAFVDYKKEIGRDIEDIDLLQNFS
jgi:uncharacterized protein (UPF0212 family)